MNVDATPASAAPLPVHSSQYWTKARRVYAIFLFAFIGMLNYLDRQILTILLEPIKKEFSLSDTTMGVLTGTLFGLVYVLAGVPLTRWADRSVRHSVLAFCVALWSGATMLCGLAQSALQLALARIGVAVGESAGTPTTLSMLSDLYPLHRRATAFAIVTCSQSAGVFVGLVLGGWLNQQFGWRAAFFAVGVPGLLAAVLLRFTVREPARGASEQLVDPGEVPPWADVISWIKRQKSLCALLLATMLASVTGYGVLVWAPTYFIRLFEMSTIEVGWRVGACITVALVLGNFGAARIADMLGKRDIRWYAWVGAIGTLLSAPFCVLFALATTAKAALLYLFCFEMLLTSFANPTYAMAATLVPPRMRTVTLGAVAFMTTLAGLGIGPMMIGMFNDTLLQAHGTQGLRYSLLSISVGAVLGGLLFTCAGMWLRADRERVIQLGKSSSLT
jgi:MFS family permease